MNKAYKYTLTANEHKEITFDVGVNRLAISNANGTDGSGGGVTYSLEEKNTGVKWIDGKVIYTKTIIVNSSNLNYGTENNVAHNIPNIETPINFDGLFRFKSAQKSRISNLYLVPEYYNQEARLSAAWGCAVFGFDTDNIVYYMGKNCLPDIECLVFRGFYTKLTT